MNKQDSARGLNSRDDVDSEKSANMLITLIALVFILIFMYTTMWA
jgi:hypothetical protein